MPDGLCGRAKTCTCVTVQQTNQHMTGSLHLQTLAARLAGSAGQTGQDLGRLGSSPPSVPSALQRDSSLMCVCGTPRFA